MKKAKPRKQKLEAVQPEDLPLIERGVLLDKHGRPKLNPWRYKGLTFRITGYEIAGDLHTIKCIETGRYQEATTKQIEKLCNL